MTNDLMELYRNGSFKTAEELQAVIVEKFPNAVNMLDRWRYRKICGVTEKTGKFLQSYLNARYKTSGEILTVNEMSGWLKHNYFVGIDENMYVKQGKYVDVTGFFKKGHKPVYSSEDFRDVLASFSTWCGENSLMCKTDCDLIRMTDMILMDVILNDIMNCVRFAPWVKSIKSNHGRRKTLSEYKNITGLHSVVEEFELNYVSFTDAVIRFRLSDEEIKHYIDLYIEDSTKNLPGVSRKKRYNNTERDTEILSDWLNVSGDVSLSRNKDCIALFGSLAVKYGISKYRIKAICNMFVTWMSMRIYMEATETPTY